MILFIDTTCSEKIVLALLDKSGEVLVRKNIPAKYKQSERLLKEIEKLRNLPTGQAGKEIKGKINKISGIIVVKGPGSFTALRIGITTANSLGFGLNIPVVGVIGGGFTELIEKGIKLMVKGKTGKYVMPEYGMEPNIG